MLTLVWIRISHPLKGLITQRRVRAASCRPCWMLEDYNYDLCLTSVKISNVCFVESPQKGSRKPKKNKTTHTLTGTVSCPLTGTVFSFRFYDSGIGKRIESFDPEREPRANSIRNGFTFVPDSCKHCALKCRVTRGGMKKPERAHSGMKLDLVPCKHNLSRIIV